MTYDVIPSDDKVVEFFENFQAGEDTQRSHQDGGNSIAFRRVEKIVYLQLLLTNENQPHDASAIACRFQEMEKSGRLTFSTNEAKIGGLSH